MKRLKISANCLLVSMLLISTAVRAQVLPSAAPEDVGMSSERLARIRPVMEQYVKQGRNPGIVTMIARHGKIVYTDVVGMMDRDSNTAMRPDALFRIASMSKPVTAVAIMILYEEGRFLLDDPVSNYIPEFADPQIISEPASGGSQPVIVPAKHEVTIRNLLQHTSGIPYGHKLLNERYRKAGIGSGLNPTEGTIGDMVKKLAGEPLLFEPGERWEYGLSIDVLGYLVEVLSGKTLEEFMTERIFRPLGMNDTGFWVPEEKMSRLASYYFLNTDGILENRPSAGQLGPKTRYFSGGAGLISSASDYLRFAQMLLNGGKLGGVRILSRKTVELMTAYSDESFFIWEGRDGVRDTHGDRYGFGLGIRTEPRSIDSIGSFSWGGAYFTLFWADPKEQLVGVFMCQLNGPYIREQHRKFKVLANQAIVD